MPISRSMLSELRKFEWLWWGKHGRREPSRLMRTARAVDAQWWWRHAEEAVEEEVAEGEGEVEVAGVEDAEAVDVAEDVAEDVEEDDVADDWNKCTYSFILLYYIKNNSIWAIGLEFTKAPFI
jgi:hypothetical protein